MPDDAPSQVNAFQACLRAPFATLGITTTDTHVTGIRFLAPSAPAIMPRKNSLAFLACVQIQSYLDNGRFEFDLPLKLSGTRHQLVPTAWAAAEPSAHVTKDAFERIAAMIVDGIRDARRVHADRGHGRDRRIAWLRPDRLGAQRGHLAGRVRALERRQVHAADREVERPELRGFLDRALGEGGGAFVSPDLVYAPHTAHERAEVREGERSRHDWDYATARPYQFFTKVGGWGSTKIRLPPSGAGRPAGLKRSPSSC